VCGDGLAAFLEEGNWLIGFESDGTPHYSWIEFTEIEPGGGTISVSDLVCETCQGWLECEGEGTYSVSGPEVMMELPSECDARAVWTFVVFQALPYGTGSGVMASYEVTVGGVVYGATVHRGDSSCDVLPEICP
jgi:hypothetical protein